MTDETMSRDDEKPVEEAATAAEAEAAVSDAPAETEAAEEPVAQADVPTAEVPDEAPAEEAPAEEPATEASADEAQEPVSEAEPVAEEAEPAAVSGPKRKRKRLPRSERRQRVKPKRETPAERKPITRLPKPEHARGRRQERQGTVVSAAPDKTIVVRVDVVKLHPMYKKVIRRSTKLHAHDEANEAKVGDVVRIVETRPLSKMKRWRLQEIVEAAK
jgi:small subunit ribosomal protein S17